MNRLLILLLMLLMLVPSSVEPAVDTVNDKMDHDDIICQLEQLGIKTEKDEIIRILDEYPYDPEIAYVLVYLGCGHFDTDTGIWTPGTDQLYAFDLEVFDEEKMYTYFLQGVQSIVPDIVITDIQEDLSGLDINHEGKRSVSFVCNGHPYSFKLKGMHDWFDVKMLDYMKTVIDKENCPYKLYYYYTVAQCVALFYGPREKADKIGAFLQ